MAHELSEKAYIGFSDWTGGRAIATFGTNAGSETLPFQTWRRFKEAFAPELVERALHETVGPVRHIVDPFGGSGTTALAAQFLGIRPTTIEVNPYLADLIEAKLEPLDLDAAAADFGRVVERVANAPGPIRPVFRGAPATFVEPGDSGRYIFSRAVARRFIAHRDAIDQIQDAATRRFFRVILASAAVPISNVVVSGKGRRYRQSWRTRVDEPEVVDALFQDGVLRALYDLGRFARRRCIEYRVMRGDARLLAGGVGEHDLAVFSPPYPNSFDYTDVYNVELWALGYLDSRKSNTQLRRATIRSHVQILRDWGTNAVTSTTLSETLQALQEVRHTLWNRNIPEMIGAYANDIAIVLSKLASNLRKQGRVYMVVGDSRYAGVDVPVSNIIAEIAVEIGYDVVEQEPCRSMRSSPQQGGRRDLPENLLVLVRR